MRGAGAWCLTTPAAAAAVALAAVLAACGGGGKEGEGQSGGSGGGGGGRRPVAVQVATVAPRTVADTREVTGTLAAAREARLLAQLEGAVTRVLVDEGDRVRAGQLLATFDNSVQAAELLAARTRARVARAQAERAARLLALGAASRAEQEEAQALLREAVGALRGAEARAAYGEVRAPFGGVVTAVRVNAGDVVGVQQEVVVVADPGDLRVEVPVSELDVVRLAPGDPVPVTIDALPGREFAGRVSRIYPTVDAATRQGVVEVSLRRSAPELRPGLLARLTLTVASVEDALAVPLDAVRRDVRDLPYVYVVQDVFVREPAGDAKEGGGEAKGEEKGESKGQAKGEGESGGGSEKEDAPKDSVTRRAQIVLRRPVRVGLRGGDNYVQLTAGVRPAERVVVTGDQELSDSARVRVISARGRRGEGAGAEVAGGGGGTGGGAASGGAASGGAASGGAAASAAADGGAAATAGGRPAAAGGRAPTPGFTGGGAQTADGRAGASDGGVTGPATAARSAAGASAAAGAAGAAGPAAPGGGRTPGAVGGVGATTGGGLSGAASAATGVPSRGGRTGGLGTSGRAGRAGGVSGTGRGGTSAGSGGRGGNGGSGSGGPGG